MYNFFSVSSFCPYTLCVCGLLSTKLDIYKNIKYHISLCEVFCLEITYQSPIKSLKKKNQLKTDIDALLGKSREICNFTSRLVTMLCTSTLCYVEVGLQRLTSLTVVHLKQDFILSGERLKPFFRQSMLYHHHHRNLLSNQYPF